MTTDLRAALREAMSSAEMPHCEPHLVTRSVLDGRRVRRRRWAWTTTAGVAAVTAAVLGAGLAVGPQQQQVRPAQESASGDSAERASIDAGKGVIGLPLDRFEPSQEEQAISELAFDVLMDECMVDAGFTYGVVDRRTEKRPSDRRYGVWISGEAELYGYDPPPPTPEARRLEELNAVDRPAGWIEQQLMCGEESRHVLIVSPLGSEGLGVDGYQTVLASDPAQDIRADWTSCLQEKGVPAPPGDAWIPAFAADADRESSIRLAVADVECKDSTMLVQRLGDLEAGHQAQLVLENESVLLAQREQVSATLEAARAVIASSGG